MIVENIKKACQAKGITIMELEKRTGLSQGVVYKWKSHSPSANILKKIADELDVSVDSLLKD